MSLLSKVGKFAKKALRTVAPLIPGPIGAIAGIATQMPQRGRGMPSMTGGGFPQLPRIPTTTQAGIGLPSIIPKLPGMVRSLPGVGAVGGAVARGAQAIARSPAARKWSKRAIQAVGGYTIGSAVFDAAGNFLGHRARRTMNPLNPKAARRAIRRVKAVRKLCHSIESQLPKAKSRGACPPRRKKGC